MCIIESLCHTKEISIVNHLYFDKKYVENWKRKNIYIDNRALNCTL